MGEVRVMFTVLGLGALLGLLLLVGRRFGLWTWAVAWLLSSREEKVGLTRAKGHFNANGYMVHSDSDIHLDVANGSFQRFDPVDRDFRMFNESMASNQPQPMRYNAWGAPIPPVAPDIPPQPLRPAPAPLPPQRAPPPPPPTAQQVPLPFAPQPLTPAPQPAMPSPKPFLQQPLSQQESQPHTQASPTPSSPHMSQPPSYAPPPLPTEQTSVLTQQEPEPEPGPSPHQFTASTTPLPPAYQRAAHSLPPPVKRPVPSVPLSSQRSNPYLPPPPSNPQATSSEAAPNETKEVEDLPPTLKRAMSCDSLSSDTSVVLGDLEEPNVTGYLCVGLEYDRTLCFSDMADLVVNVLEAKDLAGPDPSQPIDSYVRVYLLPDKNNCLQTRVYRNSNCPTYKEKFVFGMESAEFQRRTLMFYVYVSDKLSNTLIGEAELRLSDVTIRQPVTTWLTLTDTGQRGTEFGELMFSLSYLPTAERLTVVVVKARNLRFPLQRDTGDPFVKVYLLQHGKKVHKKKTSTKRTERCPIFNEAMIFSVPAHALQTIQLRLTVAENTGEPRAFSIGHVIVGSQASGKPLSHWNQMLTSLRKPIAMWHPLRK